MGKIPVLAPINFITGPLGSGKSVYATRLAFDYLSRGKYVALNYDLRPWKNIPKANTPEARAEALKHSYSGTPWWVTAYDYVKRKRGTPNSLEDRVRWYKSACSRCYRFEEQDDLFDFELPGDPEMEDRGLLVIDEGALRMNSRDWQARSQKNKQKYSYANKELEFMLHVRKLGWTMLLITQGFGMVDAQYRELGPTEIHMRNFAKWRMPILGTAASPVPFFVAIHWQRENRMVTGRDWFKLDKSAGHFKSSERFSVTEERMTGMRQMTQYINKPRPVHHFPHPDEKPEWWDRRSEGKGLPREAKPKGAVA